MTRASRIRMDETGAAAVRRDRTPAALPPGRLDREAGITVVEVTVASLLMLIVALAAYAVMDWSKRSYVGNTDLVSARTAGRAILDLVGTDLRAAGYSPLGARFAAVPAGTADRVRVLSDRDGDGTVGTSTEAEENVTWELVASGDAFTLRRGVDLTGDGDFADTGESVETVASDVVRVDVNSDGTVEPFFVFDAAPPNTNRVQVTFGIRSAHRDLLKRRRIVTSFQTEVVLRNRI